jgi:hypothetical protein
MLRSAARETGGKREPYGWPARTGPLFRLTLFCSGVSLCQLPALVTWAAGEVSGARYNHKGENMKRAALKIPLNVKVISFDDWAKLHPKQARAVEPCDACGGEGYINGIGCKKCDKRGRVEIGRRLYEDDIKRDLARLAKWQGKA